MLRALSPKFQLRVEDGEESVGWVRHNRVVYILDRNLKSVNKPDLLIFLYLSTYFKSLLNKKKSGVHAAS